MTGAAFFAFWLLTLSIFAALLLRSRRHEIATARSQKAVGGIDRVSVVILLAVATALALAVLPKADWGFTDNDIFILYYLQGRAYPPPIWESVGRFFPLGHQEWLLFLPWAIDIKQFYLLAIAQYVCFGTGVAFLLRQLNVRSHFALLLTITLPPVVVAFSSLVVPERTQIMFLPWLLWSLLRWDSTRRNSYVLLAVICAHFMLYLKEPTVLFIIGLASLRLASPLWQMTASLARGERQSLRDRAKGTTADLALLFSGLVFLALYFSIVPIDTLLSERVYDGRYLSPAHIPDSLMLWTTTEPLLPILLAIGCLQMLANLRRGSLNFADQLIIAATLYFGSLVMSGLVSTFYGALPLTAATIALLAGTAPHLQTNLKPRLAAILPSTFGLLIILNLSLAVPHLLYQQDWIARNGQLTDSLARIRAETQTSPRVFIEGHSWDAEMLAVYANGYRRLGVVFLIADERYRGNDERVAAVCDSKANLCLAYQPGAGSDDLVVDLGRLESERRATLTRGDALVWQYENEQLRRLNGWTPSFLRAVLKNAYNFW